MEKETGVQNKSQHRGSLGSNAVVVGSGITGLTAARVLVDFFDQVVVLDRDRLVGEPSFRSGIPQAQHAHTLLPLGQTILEELFPGIVDQLLDKGAEMIHPENETVYYERGIWQKPESKLPRATVSCSRPLLENQLYHRISHLPQVSFLSGYEAIDLVASEEKEKVTGITVRNLQTPGESPYRLSADLVVDASGRNSKTPQWLGRIGFTPPEEWRIDAHAGYASRIYHRLAGQMRGWKKLYIGPQPPDGLRGGVIIPLEGNRWHVTLIGLSGDYPPTDEKGFLDYANSLPVSDLYEAIQGAQPLSRITGYRNNVNRVRRFENLPRFLEGLLVMGDAVYTMNPIYSLGMTAAAIGSKVLEQALQRAIIPFSGLSAAFQAQLASRINTLWQQAVKGDWLWPATDIADNTEVLYPLAG